MIVRVDVAIDASPNDVWRFLEPIERHVDWMVDAAKITFASAQTRGIGTEFDCLTTIGPFRLNDRMVVTEWQPGRAMGIEHRGLVTGRGRFTLTAQGDRTRFAWTEVLRFPAWMGGALGEMAAKPALEGVWRRNLRTLRTLVEDA